MSDHHDNVNEQRRRFLVASVAASATVGAGTSLQGCSARANSCSIEAGSVSATNITVADIPINAVVQPTGASFLVGRDNGGFFAYSNICTHMGCAVPSPCTVLGMSTCPCHGSQYNGNGDVLFGAGGTGQPDLAHYEITFTGTGPTAQVTVNTANIVADRARRFAPP